MDNEAGRPWKDLSGTSLVQPPEQMDLRSADRDTAVRQYYEPASETPETSCDQRAVFEDNKARHGPPFYEDYDEEHLRQLEAPKLFN
ncbi:hypothetical protein LTR29_016499 [Friedmanniomyces endolithicus]|nr:hypothetical protein LTR29_016499 [Friedmanniomyces endolithicus]